MAPPHHVYFVFLDGVGLGPAEEDHNPFARLHLPTFERLAGGARWTVEASSIQNPTHIFRPIDATLDVEGLPQSGTGQATLFTGINCALLAGRHYGPFAPTSTRPVLAEHNLFQRLLGLGLPHRAPAAFANAYPPRFFEQARQRGRWSVTTLCCRYAGLPIRTLDDVLRGEALTADLTGEAWRTLLRHEVPRLTEAEAGRQLARIGQRHTLTLFEYFLTDKVGHGQDMEAATTLLHGLDAFLAGLLDAVDLSRDLLLLTSDHGNLEDLSTRTHTRNPVPLVALGQGAAAFADVRDLSGVTPALIDGLRPAGDYPDTS